MAGALLGASWNAWQTVPLTASLLFAVAAAAMLLPAARALGASLGGLRTDRLLWALGLLALALLALRLIDVPLDDVDPVPGDRVETGRGVGLLLALVGAAAVTYGGRMTRR